MTTTQELVERLREIDPQDTPVVAKDLASEAASRLSEMEAEIKRLREALRGLLALDPEFRHMLSPNGVWTEQPQPGSTAANAVLEARAALEHDKGEPKP